MRNDNRFADDGGIDSDVARLAAMCEAVRAATPVAEFIPFDRCSVLSSPFPEFRRVLALSWNGRGEKLDALSRLLSESANVPIWLARLAMNAAVPVDHERMLDADENHLPALMMAASALGLDPSIVVTQPSVLAS